MGCHEYLGCRKYNYACASGRTRQAVFTSKPRGVIFQHSRRSDGRKILWFIWLIVSAGCCPVELSTITQNYTVFGGVLLLLLIVGYSLVLIILNNQEKFQTVVYKLVSIMPERPVAFISTILQRLIAGLGIMASPKKALMISMYSIILWVLFSCIVYTFLLAFSIEAPFLVAVTIQVLMALGIALPSAPGFIGTFHAVAGMRSPFLVSTLLSQLHLPRHITYLFLPPVFCWVCGLMLPATSNCIMRCFQPLLMRKVWAKRKSTSRFHSFPMISM